MLKQISKVEVNKKPLQNFGSDFPVQLHLICWIIIDYDCKVFTTMKIPFVVFSLQLPETQIDAVCCAAG